MPIDEIRAKQKADQMKAIKTRLEAGSIVRIGNRLPITGRYEVLDSDGGISNNGVKVYNAQEQYGDRVLAYPRSDDTIALDSEKGSIVRPPTAFPTCPGYLAGQVFNCEEPKKKKVENFWVLFSLGGKMFVGGHRAVPEMIYDSVPPNKPLDISPGSFNMLQIWGDSLGWEACFSVGGTTAVFVTGEKSKQYTIDNNGDALNFASYGAQHLGKGFWVDAHTDIRSANFGQTGDNNYTWNRTWKSTSVDADSIAIGEGSDIFIVTQQPSPPYLGTYFRDRLFRFPTPYSSKTENYHISIVGQSSFYSEKEVESCSIMFRDRTFSLFYKTNLFYSESKDGVIDFVISEGEKDTTLFSLPRPNMARRSFEEYQPFPLFGETYRPKFFSGAFTDSYKFNSPAITQVQGRSQLLTHLDTEKSYDVKVFNVFSKASLIDGAHTIVKVDAWGIPVGAVIHDVAAWVP